MRTQLAWILVGLVGLVLALAGPVMAAVSQDVTVTGTPSGIFPPQNFRATYATGSRVEITWTNVASANTTIVRMAFDGYPATRTDGYDLYEGPGEAWYDTNDGDVYYAAWAWSDVYGYSVNSAHARLEAPVDGMLQMATVFPHLIPLLLLSTLAFWRTNPTLYLVTAGVALMTGLGIPNLMTGDTTTTLSMSIGLVVLMYAVVCVALAYFTLLRPPQRGQDGTED